MRYFILVIFSAAVALIVGQACGGFDADADGFFTDPLLCGGPLYDCDDSNREIGHGQIYFFDCDNDGLGDANNPAYLCDNTLCSDDATVTQLRGCSVQSNAMDCNDRPPEGAGVGSGVPMYPDCDSDGLGDPSRLVMYCEGSGSAPETLGGCNLVLNGDDCDDNPLNIEDTNSKVARYWDCDGDLHGDDNVGPMYICPNADAIQRTQYIKDCNMISVGGDCNDFEANVNETDGGC